MNIGQCKLLGLAPALPSLTSFSTAPYSAARRLGISPCQLVTRPLQKAVAVTQSSILNHYPHAPPTFSALVQAFTTSGLDSWPIHGA